MRAGRGAGGKGKPVQRQAHHASRITHHASRITHHASRITHHKNDRPRRSFRFPRLQRKPSRILSDQTTTNHEAIPAAASFRRSRRKQAYPWAGTRGPQAPLRHACRPLRLPPYARR
ncbi:hypothetical protein BSIN_1321 [Burkholderia singularis]|uniref:Uncharacterized protein n=1 Tax=Burkholderia singularis TaxID=1503053 RepID=A0A238GYG1_9BURK|nr:hypothetical protein BSIN_1321 [Burkholderia singularis]